MFGGYKNIFIANMILEDYPAVVKKSEFNLCAEITNWFRSFFPKKDMKLDELQSITIY
jgi:hypothetical protein